jgi:putative two-component system response regulator
MLVKSAPLHDVGKIGIRDHILLKPEQLTYKECAEMKRHTIYGRDIIKRAEEKLGGNSFLHLAYEIAESHHEKWDGSGYPNGWAGKQIPISGRIMALADVYDAIISRRVYKEPIPHSQAIQIIHKARSHHFDPDIVDAFMELREDFRKIALEHADFEEERQTLMR